MDNKQNDISPSDNESSPELRTSAEASSDTTAALDNVKSPRSGECAGDDELASLIHKNAQLEQEIAQCRDLTVRARAAADNAHKRAEREIRSARVYALENFAVSFLEVKDNLERSLLLCDVTDASLQDLHEGIGLTLKLLTKAFNRFGIKEVNPVGEVFNPTLHQAMNLKESSECPPNSVIEVMQKGYLLHDRLLRPALVTVSKPWSDNKDNADKKP